MLTIEGAKRGKKTDRLFEREQFIRNGNNGAYQAHKEVEPPCGYRQLSHYPS